MNKDLFLQYNKSAIKFTYLNIKEHSTEMNYKKELTSYFIRIIRLII
jgi:hypothetical protein